MTIPDYVSQLLEYLRIEPLSTNFEENDEYVFIQIEVGEDDTGKMIGNHGETIRALQQIVQLSFFDDLAGKRVVVNVNDYKQRREERAKEMGVQAAERALRDQRPQELPPLQSFERRAVHQALQDYEGVFTRSEGEGRGRRLVVYPDSYQIESEEPNDSAATQQDE